MSHKLNSVSSRADATKIYPAARYRKWFQQGYLLATLVVPLIAFLLLAPASATANSGSGTLSLALDPESTVPPANAPGASGTGSVTVDTTTGAISGSITVSGTTGQPTVAHVHRGAIGEAGPIVISMDGNDDGSMWTIPAGSTLDAEGIQDFNNGNLYINVHTEANAPGELRVQLINNDGNPLELIGQVYSTSALEIFWTRQQLPVVAYRIDTSNGESTILDATSFFVDGLTANTSISLTVTALDTNGNESVSDSIELTTADGGEAGIAVVDLRGEVYSASAVELFWDVSNAPVDVTFAIFRDDELVGTTDGRSFFEEGLTSGTEFTYRVEPQAGGISSTIALTTIEGISGSSVNLALSGDVYSSSALELFWQRISNAVSYRIERDSVLVDERDALSFFDIELDAGTTFVYSVSALSGDGTIISTESIELTTQ